jgi:hypothetical protein
MSISSCDMCDVGCKNYCGSSCVSTCVSYCGNNCSWESFHGDSYQEEQNYDEDFETGIRGNEKENILGKIIKFFIFISTILYFINQIVDFLPFLKPFFHK